MAVPAPAAPVPPPPLRPPTRRALRPSGWWYAATLGIVVLGVVVAGTLIFNGFRGVREVADEVTRVEPGIPGLVTFTGSGDFTLYYLGPDRAADEAGMRALEGAVGAELRPEGGGPAVPMAPYESASLGIADIENGQLVALSTFSIPQAGTYELRTDEIPGVASEEARIVVGESLYAPLADGAMMALVALGVSGVLSLVATIALAVTRGRDKAVRAEEERSAWAAGPPGWPGPAPRPAPIVPPPPPGYGRPRQ